MPILKTGIWCIRAFSLCESKINVSNINHNMLSESWNLRPHYKAPNAKTIQKPMQSLQIIRQHD